MSMAMAGQGLVAGPPPRLAYHSSFGQNPDKKQPWNSLLSSKRFLWNNQLYVGNVSVSISVVD